MEWVAKGLAQDEIESLLAQDSFSGLLERPAWALAAASSDSVATRLSIGVHLGPNQVLSLLGTGGMGQVYKARDTRLGRVVAVKVTTKLQYARFEWEARAAASLNHPNISAIYDVGKVEAVPFW
jgi:serine/threonine protein kinase